MCDCFRHPANQMLHIQHNLEGWGILTLWFVSGRLTVDIGHESPGGRGIATKKGIFLPMADAFFYRFSVKVGLKTGFLSYRTCNRNPRLKTLIHLLPSILETPRSITLFSQSLFSQKRSLTSLVFSFFLFSLSLVHRTSNPLCGGFWAACYLKGKFVFGVLPHIGLHAFPVFVCVLKLSRFRVCLDGRRKQINLNYNQTMELPNLDANRDDGHTYLLNNCCTVAFYAHENINIFLIRRELSRHMNLVSTRLFTLSPETWCVILSYACF